MAACLCRGRLELLPLLRYFHEADDPYHAWNIMRLTIQYLQLITICDTLISEVDHSISLLMAVPQSPPSPKV
jgi:hypothetical protein